MQNHIMYVNKHFFMFGCEGTLSYMLTNVHAKQYTRCHRDDMHKVPN